MTEKKRGKDALLTAVHIEESRRLKEMYAAAGHGLSQAAFGEAFGIGNQGAVWQCLNGMGMPISLKAAQGFARGLQCNIGDFSPRLAAMAEGIAASVTPNQTALVRELASPKISIEQAILRLGEALAGADNLSRKQTLLGLEELTLHPDQAGQLAPRIAGTLEQRAATGTRADSAKSARHG